MAVNFSFGTPSANTTSAAPTTNLFGTATTTPATTATPFGAGLGGGLGGNAFGTSSSFTSSVTTSTIPSFNLGQNLLGSGSQVPNQAQPFSLTTPAVAQPATSTTTNTNPNAITFRVLEEYINKWMGELDSQEKDFLNQATQLNALDKLMIENGEKIVDVNSEVERLSSDQEQLEQELNFMYSQQNDLEEAIKKLESGVDAMPMLGSAGDRLGTDADTSRIEMYKMLIEIDNQLRSSSADMKDIIRRLNETKGSVNDPAMQISKILNAHMDSLNWIDENTVLIQSQVDKLTKEVDHRMRENEKNVSQFAF